MKNRFRLGLRKRRNGTRGLAERFDSWHISGKQAVKTERPEMERPADWKQLIEVKP
jgi:hypothetical protein